MSHFDDISADTLVTPWQQQTSLQGMVGMLAIGLCLLIGHMSGHPAAGAIAAGGAFTVGFAVFHPVLESPMISMGCATLALLTATFAGSLSAQWTPAVLMVVAVAGLNYGLLSALGASAGWIGQQAAVYLVVATYFPNGPHEAFGRATMVALGGVLQMAVHLVFRMKLLPQNSPRLWQVAVAKTRDYLLERLPKTAAWGSSTLGFASRMLVTIVVTTTVYRVYHLRNGYWIPMTALLCLKPQWTGTISRSLARVLGTTLGALVAYLLAHTWHHYPLPVLGTLVMLAALGCYALNAVNYALFSMFITLYIVFLFRFGGFSETAAAHLRLMNTIAGGVFALLVDSMWQGSAWVYERFKPKTIDPLSGALESKEEA